MKNLKNNKKGFTLIELLAVIVILAVLVMIATPAITKILDESRKKTFADNALLAINAVRQDYILSGNSDSVTYNLSQINEKLEKKLVNSPYSKPYSESSWIKVTSSDGVVTYSMCLVDSGKNGFVDKTESDISENPSDVVTNNSSNSCGSVPTVTPGA